jgi:2-haloacid dehalogenase
LKTYQTLFFDVDDTLLDFAAAEKSALQRLFEVQQIPLTLEIESLYKKINEGLWNAFEEGKMSRDEVVNTRFSLLYKELGQTVDGVLFEQNYRMHLEEGHQLIDGALELISTLSNHFDLYVVTNGVSKTQDKRLRASGLHPFFKGIIVSEDTGYQKPMREFFDYVFAGIPDFMVDRGLIIGDSLTSDMKGGFLAGLDTCWYNPAGKINYTDVLPDYQIRTLDELYGILNIR